VSLSLYKDLEYKLTRPLLISTRFDYQFSRCAHIVRFFKTSTPRSHPSARDYGRKVVDCHIVTSHLERCSAPGAETCVGALTVKVKVKKGEERLHKSSSRYSDGGGSVPRIVSKNGRKFENTASKLDRWSAVAHTYHSDSRASDCR